MTIDERLHFLLQSAESLHASIHELYGTVQEHSRQVEGHTNQLKEHTRQLEIDAENIRRLANIAAAHQQRLDNHEQGLDDFEG